MLLLDTLHRQTPEFLALGQEIFPTWYRDLVYPPRAHSTKGPRPLDPYQQPLGYTQSNNQPNLISPWPGEFRIQDVINFTRWRGDKQQYNATLLFYPSLPDREIDKHSHHSSSVAYGDDSIIPSGRPEGRFLTVTPRTPSPTFGSFTDVGDLQPAGKGKGKTLHKRQISEAIPSTERDEQAVTKVGTSKEGTRIGLRPRKPKSCS